MDYRTQWKISSEVETLVEAIVICKNGLVVGCKEKHGSTKVNLLSCDVYAGDKPLQLLGLSESWTPCVEFTEEDLITPLSRRQVKTTELMADFAAFKLHRMSVLGEDVIRVVNVFRVDGHSAEQTMYGNVELVGNEECQDVS